MKFSEFNEGSQLETESISLSQEEILEFAKKYDPQWFHTDPEAAASGPYGGLIASGFQSSSLALCLVVKSFLAGSESVGSPGLAYLRWKAPVRPNDELRVRVTVLEKRVSLNKPDLGILRWRWDMLNQDESVVLELEATSLFDLKR
jgi:acyl dehydratase